MFLLILNIENSHLFPIVSISLQQTIGNVPPQNKNEAFVPEFEEINKDESPERMDQDTEVAQSAQVNKGGDAK